MMLSGTNLDCYCEKVKKALRIIDGRLKLTSDRRTRSRTVLMVVRAMM